MKPPKPGTPEAALRAHALSYPEAHEDFPWGERVIKVRGKVFLFLGKHEGLSLSVKLPGSAGVALGLPFCEPTGYGLGRSGWVTARFAERQKPPVDLLERWIDESYRAVAPRKLVDALGAVAAAAAPRRNAKKPSATQQALARSRRRRRT